MSVGKDAIRREIFLQRDQLDLSQVVDLSFRINQEIVNFSIFKQAKTVLFYAAIGNEVKLDLATQEALKLGKRVVFPRVVSDELKLYQVTDLSKDLELGYAKIPEPKTSLPEIKSTELDLILVPGIAFDPNGNRIGYGKGHFDRFLEHLTRTRMGIAYDFQLVDLIPAEEHDITMDYILTENRMIKCQ